MISLANKQHTKNAFRLITFAGCVVRAIVFFLITATSHFGRVIAKTHSPAEQVVTLEISLSAC